MRTLLALLLWRPSPSALSLAVYRASWTFSGIIGPAASSGVGFLPIYLGPTLMFLLGWFVLPYSSTDGKPGFGFGASEVFCRVSSAT